MEELALNKTSVTSFSNFLTSYRWCPFSPHLSNHPGQNSVTYKGLFGWAALNFFKSSKDPELKLSVSKTPINNYLFDSYPCLFRTNLVKYV